MRSNGSTGRRMLAIALAAGALAFLAFFVQRSVHGQSSVRLLRPGTFLIEPPRVLPTEQWFGLRRAADGWSLIRVAPKITLTPPICGDHATVISVDASNDVLILLTGVPNLSDGPIVAAINGPRFVYPGEQISIGGAFYLEALGSAIREVGGVMFENYTFWILRGRERQRVASFERNSPDGRQLLWAGDIDRDARPDLLFDLPLGDAGHNYVLFLSSMRAGDQLVSQAASFSTPGC